MYDRWNQILSYIGPSSNFCEIARTRGFINLRNFFYNHIKDFSKKEKKKSKPKLKVFFIIRNQTRLDKTKKKCVILYFAFYVVLCSLVVSC